MTRGTSRLIIALIASALPSVLVTPACAQAWHYPAFQPPEIAVREFNFAVAGGGDYGTTGLAQWREGIGPDTHFSAEIGFASPSGSSTLFLIGAGLGQRILRSTPETPIDMVLTGGIYGAFSGDGSVVRLPVGVSVGHRFPLQGGLAITPYAHPRLSVDVCASHCGNEGTSLKVNFDVGADFEVSRMLALRGALTVGGVDGGDSKVGVGFGLAFKPQGVRH